MAMTATTAEPAVTNERSWASLRTWTSVEWMFLAGFAAFTAFAVGVLLAGLVSALAGSLPALHDWLHMRGLAYAVTGRLADAMGDAAHLRESTPGLIVDYAVSALNLTLAGLLLWLRPRERTARLLALGMVGTAAVFNLQAYRIYESMITGTAVDTIHYAFHVVTAASYIAALLLFPDGRLVPRWPAVRLVALYVPVVAAIAALGILIGGASRTLAIILLFGLVTPAAGVAAQAYRYRHAQDPVERQQSRLLFWALLPSVVVGALALMPGILTSIQPVYEQRPIPVVPALLFHVFQIAFTVIPIALIVGLLRFRLWQIDRVISRTLAYGALAVLVAAVYVLVVVVLGSIVGGRNTLTSVVAAGVVAAAIAPAQQQVQRAANRLVYGRRATPYEVLSTLSERMGDAQPAEETMGLMARLLAEATAADRADVWLVVGDHIRLAASHPASAPPLDARDLRDGDLPDLGPVTATAPVRHGEQLLGALTVTKPRAEVLAPREQKLLGDLAAQAALVLRNARLTAELMDRLVELRASRQRMVQAQNDARRRLERNLHDGAQQQLVAIKIKLGLAHRMADSGKPLGSLLSALADETGEAIDTLRDLARGIYPPLLADQGLVAALRAQAAKAPLDITVTANDLGRFHQDIEAAVYFCCLEALQNIVKYAEADTAHIDLALDGTQLRFSVRDDGVGFDLQAAARGAGLQNIADRLDALDGALAIESRPGAGTTLRGSLPATPQRADADAPQEQAAQPI
jgi:signal transduction histidine kinase